MHKALKTLKTVQVEAMGPGHQSLPAYIQILPLLLSSWVALGELLNFCASIFLVCKMWLILLHNVFVKIK